jgi:hypothetical protein
MGRRGMIIPPESGGISLGGAQFRSEVLLRRQKFFLNDAEIPTVLVGMMWSSPRFLDNELSQPRVL